MAGLEQAIAGIFDPVEGVLGVYGAKPSRKPGTLPVRPGIVATRGAGRIPRHAAPRRHIVGRRPVAGGGTGEAPYAMPVRVCIAASASNAWACAVGCIESKKT